MKRLCLPLAPVLLTIAVATARADVDTTRLRKLVRMPLLPMTMVFAYNSDNGYEFITESSMSQKKTPESILKTLRGDDEDAKRYFLLGIAYNESKNTVEANKAWERSLELYRKQLQHMPRDGERLAGVVQVLNALDRTTERDAALATALKLAPNNSRVWTTRVFIDMETAMSSVFGPSIAQALAANDTAAISTWFVSPPLTKQFDAQIRQARLLLQQAKADYDKAVTLAPKSDEIYTDRAFFAATYHYDMALLNLAKKKEPVTSEQMTELQRNEYLQMLQPGPISDLVTAARLSHNEPFAVGMAAFFAMSAEFAKKESPEFDAIKENRLKILSPATQQIVQELLAKLATLSHASDRQLAARSAMALGALQMILLTPTVGEASLRQAATALSDDPRLVDSLTIAYVKAERWTDLNALLTQALKRRESARWRLLLAKTEAHQEHWAEAEQDIRTILMGDPLNLDANLALFAVMLRSAADADSLQIAGRQFDKIDGLNPHDPDEDQFLSYLYLRSIYLGLTGDLAGARQSLEALQEHGNADQAADIKAVMALLSAQ